MSRLHLPTSHYSAEPVAATWQANGLRVGAASATSWAAGEWWSTEPDVGRVAHGVAARVDRLKGLALRLLRLGRQENGGQLNPMWVEWLMGWPPGWTALDVLAMDKFRPWLESQGMSND